MTRYEVVPSGSHWDVKTASGRVTSTHRKKARAVAAGRRYAGAGDMLVIHRANGTIQERRAY